MILYSTNILKIDYQFIIKKNTGIINMEQVARDVTIENEHNVSKRDIINEAYAIWDEAQKVWAGIKPLNSSKKQKKSGMKIKKSDHELLDAHYHKVCEEHKDFVSAYPTVMRHMIQEKWFHKKAFADYMTEVEKSPWTNDSQRMDSYTRYAELLMRATSPNKHVNKSVVAAFKKDYRARLQSEHDQFINDYKRFKDEQDAEKKAEDAEKRIEYKKTFNRICVDADVKPDYIEQVNTLIDANMLSTKALETVIYDIRRTIAGVSVDEIRKENADFKKQVEENQRNTSVCIPDKMDEVHAERVRALAAEKAGRDAVENTVAVGLDDDDEDADTDDLPGQANDGKQKKC